LNRLKRLADEWTVLAILFGLFIGFVCHAYTTDVARTLLYGAAALLLAAAAFNASGSLLPGARGQSLLALYGLIALQTVAAGVLAVLAASTILGLARFGYNRLRAR
jgi:hypothetical protein